MILQPTMRRCGVRLFASLGLSTALVLSTACAPRQAVSTQAAGPTAQQPAPTSPAPPQGSARSETWTRGRLPTGAFLDPEGTSVPLGSFPMAMALSPDRRHAAVLMNGWREQGLQVVDRATGNVQTLAQPAAFLGVAFAPDGSALYTSGGNQDVIYVYDWRDGAAALQDSVVLAPKTSGRRQSGVSYPAGLALSPDGSTMYVAENLYDSLAAVDVATRRVVQRFPAGRYPYGVVVAGDGMVYVSPWAGTSVRVFRPDSSGTLQPDGKIPVGRHPSALLLSASGGRLFVASASTDRVAVVDTYTRRVLTQLVDAAPEGPTEGSTPNALALSADGTRLYVAEADNNAVAEFVLSAITSGVARAAGDDRLAGRIPVGWYPSALALSGDTLLVVNGKGAGAGPNPGLPQPGVRGTRAALALNYTLGQLLGTLSTIPLPDSTQLAAWSARVARANGWDGGTHARAAYPPFKHVVYIIKENRTYDQVLGDMKEGDGDTSLVFFPRRDTPNHHALAERFGLFDRFFVNAEVSADGHNWSTAAYASDYVEKTVQSNYSGRGRSYDYEGTNRGWDSIPPEGEDVNEPANGYLWDLAQRAGITFRNYGEFAIPNDIGHEEPVPPAYRGTKPFLAAHTSPDFAAFDLNIQDQKRADVFLKELTGYERRGDLPQLIIMHLPNDHNAGGTVGAPTPEAYMADNDLALGRIVEGLSHSQFWPNTVIFVLEDDAQNGPDHVDSHRSPLFVISPYNRPGVIHRFANTTDVIATIADILHLGSLSQFDHFGRPLRGIWAATADLKPYKALTPEVSLNERNKPNNPGAEASKLLDLRSEDMSNDELFNRILWAMIKGPDRPYPGAKRMSVMEWWRSR
ncbi:MAG: bifunctional YncE family protein/alkaline phosphatase family protein [Gemmatimonadota bacterium]